MRGQTRPISLHRRLIIDLMHASRDVPFVSLERTLQLGPLLDARAAADRPPGFAALFVKAFALVARDEPVLRSLYVKWPWPCFYELPRSVATVTIARVENGEDCVLPQRVSGPETMTLAEVDAVIRQGKEAPVGDVPMFRKIMRATRLPLPLRRFAWWVGLSFGRQRANWFGNFSVTSVAACGGGQLLALSPGPFIINYDVVRPDQTVRLLIRWDHRVTDGAMIARTAIRLEQVLNGEIAVELRALPSAGPDLAETGRACEPKRPKITAIGGPQG
ncbi:acyltransferase [Bradyrhizobium sp. HKCCYLR20261]|uniref:acyltransferase n=1 Tax=Bradyrhizobium sp. HKCCYLR20261 TaxID=3420760 RepID=UPI003EC11E5C